MAVPLRICVIETDPARPAPTKVRLLTYAAREDRPDVRNGLTFLATLIGRNLPIPPFAPFAMSMGTSFMHAAPEAVRLHRLLLPLSTQQHLPKIVERQVLAGGSLYLHGMTLLELAYEAQRRDRPVYLHPPGAGGIVSDVDIDGMRIEVTSSTDADRPSEWSRVSMQLLERLHLHGLAANDVHVDLGGAPYDGLADDLVRGARLAYFALDRACPVGQNLVRIEPGRGRVCHPSDTRTLAQRVLRAAKAKMGRVSEFDGPVVLVVRVDGGAASMPDLPLARCAREIVDRLASRWRHVAGIVALVDGFLPGVVCETSLDGHYFTSTFPTAGGAWRRVVLFQNPNPGPNRKALSARQARLLYAPGGLFDER